MATSKNYGLPVHQYQPEYYTVGAKVRSSEISYEYFSTTANTTLVANTVGNSGTCHSLVEVTSGSPTITLPAASTASYLYFVIKNSGAGTVTLASAGGTIDGASTQSIAQYASLTIVSNGTNWILI
jgi:hypothetical protein